jgi:hypothetical protein
MTKRNRRKRQQGGANENIPFDEARVEVLKHSFEVELYPMYKKE